MRLFLSRGCLRFRTIFQQELVRRLLRKKLALRAIAELAEKLGEKVIDKLTMTLQDIVNGVIPSQIVDAFKEFADNACTYLQAGVPLQLDLREILKGPEPNLGELKFLTDGTAQYLCPTSIEPNEELPDSISFSAEKKICEEKAKRTVSVTCGTKPVTITIGDNGPANDDIFEVKIAGKTVLTSSVPTRSTSTTITLTVGEHAVELIGRAAPDGIGTYFIRFDGATVISGDTLSGDDLTPGVVKAFRIKVP